MHPASDEMKRCAEAWNIGAVRRYEGICRRLRAERDAELQKSEDARKDAELATACTLAASKAVNKYRRKLWFWNRRRDLC